MLLVDPSLFTSPYDGALTDGLLAAGVEPLWAVRPTRAGDHHHIPPRYVDPFFYQRTDRARFPSRGVRAIAKGVAHLLGLAKLTLRVLSHRPDVVHFQWLVAPLLDAAAVSLIRRVCPVVVTVHDTVPFNGDQVSRWQTIGFDSVLRLSDFVIVHTRAGKATLAQRGLSPAQIAVIPHGPLTLPTPTPKPTPTLPTPPPLASRRDNRHTFVLFGELKPYKGIDVLVEAIGSLPAPVRAQARFVIAGRPRMDLAPLARRIAELGLDQVVELRPRRLTDEEMRELLHEADCFVFPYRQIDASGVYFLTKPLGKWVIASRVGVFAEDLQDGIQGALIPPNDAPALAAAIGKAITDRPSPPTPQVAAAWVQIGESTRVLYQRALDARGRIGHEPLLMDIPS